MKKVLLFTSVLVNTAIANAQVTFSSVTTYNSTSSPFSLTNADFNGDGKIDIAVANHNSNNVNVYLGNGTGGFGAPASLATGQNPISITSADFDGDNKMDLAVANEMGYNVSVFFGNGSGTFNTAVNISLPATTDSNGVTNGSHPSSIISEDFNEDGNPDMAVSHDIYGDGVYILLGDGQGNFGTVADFGTGTTPVSITAADFNNDNNIDIVATNQTSNDISILLGDGLGGFAAPTNIAVGTLPQSSVSHDFNSDGNADLAVSVNGGNKITVLMGNGAGNFGSPVYFLAGNNPFSIGCSDFDSDGIADLVTSNISDNIISILLGDGTGSFGNAINFYAGNYARELKIADLNGDNKMDITAINSANENTLSILLNTTERPGPPICLVTVDSTHTHNVVVWEKTNLNLATIDSFIVYREITTNNYQPIGAVAKDSLSIFHDIAANPESTGYRYKLKSKDSGGTESLFSEYHNSIYLSNNGANFFWTPYQIENNTTPIASYNIYRDDNSTGNFQQIGITTGNQLGYTDVSFASFPNASYYVEAIMNGGGCNPTRSSFSGSRSNVKHVGTSGIQQLSGKQKISIYPSPANSTLTVSGITERSEVRLYDVLGKIVYTKQVEKDLVVDTSIFPNGVYMISVETNDYKNVQRIVISH